MSHSCHKQTTLIKTLLQCCSHDGKFRQSYLNSAFGKMPKWRKALETTSFKRKTPKRLVCNAGYGKAFVSARLVACLYFGSKVNII